jgi:predicted peroxiredoxin
MTRLLYILSHSTEAPERATTSLAAALAGQRLGHEVDLWLSGEGARLGVRGVAETLNEPGPETAAAMLAALAADGATLHVERVAFEQRQFAPEVLLPAAELADAGQLAHLVADGWLTVTL